MSINNIPSSQRDIERYVNNLYFRDRSHQRYILHVGPTNSGKTYKALQAFDQDKSGCYLSPLRLLAYEVFEGLNEQGYDCSLITGEEKIIRPNASFLSATVEMCPTEHFSTMIIDECSKLNDEYRGEKWLRAILTNNADEVHLILNEESQYLVEELLRQLAVSYEVETHERKGVLLPSPERQSMYNLPAQSVLVCFSRKIVHELKEKLEELGRRVSIIYGDLPPDVKKYEMKRFIDGETEICVSTDAIGMGLNLPCEQVIFYQVKKHDGKEFRTLTPFEAKQIAGRAGRYGQYEIGYFSAIRPKDEITLRQLVADKKFILQHTYMGIDFHILEMMEGYDLDQKLENYDRLPLVPDGLKHIILPQSITKYDDNYYEKLEEFDLEVAFAFLCSPVKGNNEEYYIDAILDLYQNDAIYPPEKVYINRPIKKSDMQRLENYLSEVDLYVSMSNNATLSKYIDFDESVLEERKMYNEAIIRYLSRKRRRRNMRF
ncbi:MAG: helicase-related protein [Bacteroidota bacterium]